MCKVASSSSQPCQAGGNIQFLWDVASSLPLLLKDGTTNYIYGPGELPLEQVSGATTLWYHHDQIGSTRLVTNSTGVSQATYTYDPYGGLASSTGSITNPFRYTGQYLDTESGFYYLRARYYDPTTGQLLTLDPLVASTRQPYLYAEDTPTNRTDPTGLFGWGICAEYRAEYGGAGAVQGANAFSGTTGNACVYELVPTTGPSSINITTGGGSCVNPGIDPNFSGGGGGGFYVGASGGVSVTNANYPEDLEGRVHNVNFNLALGISLGGTFSWNDNGT
jgi:RHS repeat-associated protein